MQRPYLASVTCGVLCVASLCECRLSVDVNERIEFRLQGLDSGEVRGDDLHRREFSCANTFRNFGDGCVL
jgi:hypothetical protein